ncbi:MAG TPA: carboxypeptidase-like regulatory domain-containing protein [Bacteroidales bacterium]|nr:carboxypeptidase-like regulatory domain-containing protein [Bacteroidales bacterium]
MKRYVQRLHKLMAINRVLDNHPVLFEEKPQAQAVKDTFTGNIDRITNLVSALSQPVSNVYSPKIESEKILRTLLSRMAGFGILIARRNKNEALISQMRTYKRLSLRATAHTVYENALFVANELQNYQSLATELGLAESELSSFRVAAEEFGNTLHETGFQLSDRKTNWKELKSLFTQCVFLLRDEIDQLVVIRRDSDPDLYREYMTLRRGNSRKNAASAEESSVSEITGTVTASDTGLPVEGVTVEIPALNISTVTDEDGYYQLEDVPVGQLSISCHMTGYVTPEAQIITSVAGDSLLVDFSITPAEPAQANAA